MSSSSLSNREILSVAQLNQAARRLLEGEFPNIFVEGEISNFSRPSSGHWYFTLKDDNAQIRCAMFKNRNSLIRFKPQNGTQIVLRGKISLYEGRGDFQLIAEFMEEAGDGALRRAFEKLKAQLLAEGLFDQQHKQPIPAMPRHIAIITSPTGAAIHDVLHVLKRRFPAIEVSIIPVQVQGDDSPRQIVNALAFANAYVGENTSASEQNNPFDLILLTRGGGSLEDLWSFNTEPVARAIFASRLPVVSAVGHETDVSIADFVADVRAPTPSAAAELISPSSDDWLQTFIRYEKNLTHLIATRLKAETAHIEHLSRRLRHPGQRVQDLQQRLDDLELRLKSSYRHYLSQFRFPELQSRLVRAMNQTLSQAHNRVAVLTSRQRHPGQQIGLLQQTLTHLSAQLHSGMTNQLKTRNSELREKVSRLDAMSPLNTIKRGYSIVTVDDKQGDIVRSVSALQTGSKIKAQVMDGEIFATVTQTVTQTVTKTATTLTNNTKSPSD